ncbi:hypothetical protein Patl1_04259 [Pistacia atlantica]|uniref:Uncharacterized protein n=1 Tax=Pistacia atlantica TaxID=434234 RepID=A0ACC1BSK1_9ROSI|nr:hypothetical protein Patl1_04259 [Pistacia atlantica]
MGCFSCCIPLGREARKSLKRSSKDHRDPKNFASSFANISFKTDSSRHRYINEEISRIGKGNITAKIFSYRELCAATTNFTPENLLGEGGFGRVYRGKLENQLVAVKQLDRNGFQGNREFLVEVLMLSLLSHPNLVNLVGYCADGDQRILVYEYMAGGSLEDHLLELITGRRVIDNSRPTEEQNLVAWATPLFRDRRKFTLMADPLLEGNYPLKGLYQALAVAAMCLQEEATTRPLMSDVVTALEYLANKKKEEEDSSHSGYGYPERHSIEDTESSRHNGVEG